MRRIKWIVAAAVMGTLFFGCKAKEQTAEAPPPEQPKPAEAPPAGRLCCDRESFVGAHRRRPLLQSGEAPFLRQRQFLPGGTSLRGTVRHQRLSADFGGVGKRQHQG